MVTHTILWIIDTIKTAYDNTYLDRTKPEGMHVYGLRVLDTPVAFFNNTILKEIN